jgi:NAD(P)-dependent dehydrogenase (short-subunit alcohol dehydrogenase family)
MSDASEARRVVVTGSSSGIGLVTALRFVADGATVVSLDAPHRTTRSAGSPLT